jgi:glutathione synthase
MKIAFLMDDLTSIDPLMETTSYLMYECNQRGHTVYFLEHHDVYIRENKVMARMQNITVEQNFDLETYWKALIKCLNQDELIFEMITDLDVLFLRKNPPISYQAMEFLGPVSEKVFIINNTIGQINSNSKMYTLNFPDIIPETHVSRDPERLRRVIDSFGGDMIIKPFHGFAGDGVIKVNNRDQENLNSLIDYYVKSSRPYLERHPIMVQEYIKHVKTQGDVRILLLNGEILGSIRRKSVPGDFRTNVIAGARSFKHDVTSNEVKICEKIKNLLKKDGLYLVEVDIIGDKLIKINSVNPGGIPTINRFNNDKLEARVIDFIENKSAEFKNI